jgi:hypothetical protein
MIEYSNVMVSLFPLTVQGIPDETTYIQIESLGDCGGTQCILVSNKVTPTPTPTNTTTPTPTPTSTETPTPTPTPTDTPTPTPTPDCNFVVDTDNITTPTPTPTATNTPTPTPTPTATPDCDFNVDTDNITTPTPTPTSTPTPTATETPTPTPTPTLDCTFGASFTEMIDEIPGEGAPCSSGMDVVFLVDYTGSMSGAIAGIKSSISSIANTISTESNNNYRLGLVIFDEYTSGTVSEYSTNSAYTSLPSAQKYVNTGVGGKYQWITAMQKMSLNNISSFSAQLGKLLYPMPLGDGIGGPEPSDMGIDLVATNNKVGYEYFAGAFRSNVSKLIILITDNYPGGNDDTYNQTDIDFVNGLTPQLLNQNIKVLLMSTYMYGPLQDLANGTNGASYVGFSGAQIITAIQNICP